MTDSILHFVDKIAPLIIFLGPAIYIVIGILSLLESIPLVGLFMPGTMGLLFFGFMASERYINAPTVIAAVAIGAIGGDLVGYYLGKYGSRFIKEHKGLLRTGHLEMGRVFFKRHGGKSILIARFVGVIRSIVPLVAGSVHMPIRRFMIFNFIGAFLWAAVYVSLGYFFGSQIDFISKLISRGGTAAVIVIAGIVAVIFYIRKSTAKKLVL